MLWSWVLGVALVLAEVRRRRQVIGVMAAVVAGVAISGVIALPVLQPAQRQGGQPAAVGRPQPSATCTAPTAAPMKLPAAEAAKDSSPDSRTAKVFLARTATPTDEAAIQARLRSLPVIVSLDFVDHQSAWQRFAEQFCYAPDLVAATSADSLPESFHLVLKQPGDLATVKSALAGMPGVDSVLHTPE